MEENEDNKKWREPMFADWKSKYCYNWYIYNATFTPKAQGTVRKRRLEDCKIQRIRTATVRQCFLYGRGKWYLENVNNAAT